MTPSDRGRRKFPPLAPLLPGTHPAFSYLYPTPHPIRYNPKILMRTSFPPPIPLPPVHFLAFHFPNAPAQRSPKSQPGIRGAGVFKPHDSQESWARTSSLVHLPVPGFLSRAQFFKFPTQHPHAARETSWDASPNSSRSTGFAGAVVSFVHFPSSRVLSHIPFPQNPAPQPDAAAHIPSGRLPEPT